VLLVRLSAALPSEVEAALRAARDAGARELAIDLDRFGPLAEDARVILAALGAKPALDALVIGRAGEPARALAAEVARGATGLEVRAARAPQRSSRSAFQALSWDAVAEEAVRAALEGARASGAARCEVVLPSGWTPSPAIAAAFTQHAPPLEELVLVHASAALAGVRDAIQAALPAVHVVARTPGPHPGGAP